MKFTVVDCGQGDCIILRNGYKQAVIDCGDFFNKTWQKTRKILAKQLLINQKHYLECLVTHFDSDHYAGFIRFLDEFSFGKIRMYLHYPSWFEPNVSPRFVKFTDTLREHNVEVLRGVPQILAGLKISCYYPAPSLSSPGGRNYNDESIVFSISNGKVFTLFTGDSERMLNLALARNIGQESTDMFTILKVSHHGSQNGTEKNFINALKPNLSFISVGNPNRYDRRYPGKMPHYPTLKLLGEQGNHRNTYQPVYFMTEPNHERHYYYELDVKDNKVTLFIKASSNNALIDEIEYDTTLRIS